jgi:hypothetical protein
MLTALGGDDPLVRIEASAADGRARTARTAPPSRGDPGADAAPYER